MFVIYYDINPILLELKYIKIYWYGFLHFSGFFISYILILKNENLLLKTTKLYLLLNILTLSIIFGGKIGYVILYENCYKLETIILKSIKFWKPGRSYFGGLFLSFVSILIMSQFFKINFYKISDPLIKYIPINIILGRIGNFINCELYGIENKIFGIIFPSGGPNIRHPTQIYEIIFEGFILSFIIFFFKKTKPTILFLIFYGCFRFIIEIVKKQNQMYYFSIDMTLSFIIFIIGIILYIKNI